jgi:hypothetical protein
MRTLSKPDVALVGVPVLILVVLVVIVQFLVRGSAPQGAPEVKRADQEAVLPDEAVKPPPPAALRERVARQPVEFPNLGTSSRVMQPRAEQRTDMVPDAVRQALREQPDDQLRTKVLYETLRSGTELPADFLTELALYDRSSEVRFLALQALTPRSEVEAVARLALNDPSPHVRTKAQEILLGLEPARQSPPAGQGANAQ